MRSGVRKGRTYAGAVQVGLDERRRDALLAQIELRNAQALEEPRITPAIARFAAILMLADHDHQISSPAALAEAEALIQSYYGKTMEQLTAALLDLELAGSVDPLKESERTAIARILRFLSTRAGLLESELFVSGAGRPTGASGVNTGPRDWAARSMHPRANS